MHINAYKGTPKGTLVLFVAKKGEEQTYLQIYHREWGEIFYRIEV